MTYTCPMHPSVKQEGPGSCPICGMALVPESQVKQKQSSEKNWLQTYRPLLIIVGLITLVTAVLGWSDAQAGNAHWMRIMQYFMAGFFLVFSGFKLLDLPGFAEGYATYDLLAKRVKAYGYVYPFLELALGLAYATAFRTDIVNVATLLLMIFSGFGVAIKVMKGERFKCACLGTFIDVPLTVVTIVEDFGMAIMATVMLLAT